MKERIKNICITTNVECNLRCYYCYENKQGNDVFDVEQTKNKLKEQLSCIDSQLVVVDFHGGEPFLVFEKIKELCEWVWSQKFPQEFLFYATSNGTLVHGEIKDWLFENKHRFKVNLSLDGTREMHNMNRSNSFDLIDVDFFATTWPDQTVKMTVSPLTINHLAEGVEYIHSKGFQDIAVHFACMVNWNNPMYLKSYYQELSKLSEFYKANPHLNKDSMFNLDITQINNSKFKTRKWCGIGEDCVQCYTIDGEKYPCHLFLENVCGKEKSLAWRDIDFNDPDEYIKGECRTCAIYPICPTCYAANYIERGHIGSRDMNLCKLEKTRALVVAKYHYDKIVSGNEDISKFSESELRERKKTLDTLVAIAPLMEKYQDEINSSLNELTTQLSDSISIRDTSLSDMPLYRQMLCDEEWMDETGLNINFFRDDSKLEHFLTKEKEGDVKWVVIHNNVEPVGFVHFKQVSEDSAETFGGIIEKYKDSGLGIKYFILTIDHYFKMGLCPKLRHTVFSNNTRSRKMHSVLGSELVEVEKTNQREFYVFVSTKENFYNSPLVKRVLNGI